MELTIQSLTQLVDGQLRMAAMPPLAGIDEPLGRLVTEPANVSQGDVLIVSDALRARHALCETEAYDRGALGVVGSGGVIEPWPGRFSVQVEDAAWALWQLAGASRCEYDGQIIAVTGSVGKNDIRRPHRCCVGLVRQQHGVQRRRQGIIGRANACATANWIICDSGTAFWHAERS